MDHFRNCIEWTLANMKRRYQITRQYRDQSNQLTFETIHQKRLQTHAQ